ncbi:MAG: flagellar biosynthesis anti-sigma factor FlgM [Deltaproteobacteria bacterium]|nr:flagellar biosynthesis anti-sigma factor FlgM [Deltaproteobacteria bacterium]
MKVTGTSPGSTENVRGPGGASVATEVREKRRGGRPSGAGDIGSGDKVSISSKAKDAAKAARIAKAAPDVDEEKVARLKAAIQSGTYGVDADKIADRLVDDHMATAL